MNEQLNERVMRAAEEIKRIAGDTRYPEELKLWMIAKRIQQEIDKTRD